MVYLDIVFSELKLWNDPENLEMKKAHSDAIALIKKEAGEKGQL